MNVFYNSILSWYAWVFADSEYVNIDSSLKTFEIYKIRCHKTNLLRKRSIRSMIIKLLSLIIIISFFLGGGSNFFCSRKVKGSNSPSPLPILLFKIWGVYNTVSITALILWTIHIHSLGRGGESIAYFAKLLKIFYFQVWYTLAIFLETNLS